MSLYCTAGEIAWAAVIAARMTDQPHEFEELNPE